MRQKLKRRILVHRERLIQFYAFFSKREKCKLCAKSFSNRFVFSRFLKEESEVSNKKDFDFGLVLGNGILADSVN